MSPITLAAFIAVCIAPLLPVITRAQTTMYVAYDGALVYADADYLSDIIDTLRIGDSVIVYERDKRFARIRTIDNEAWVLIANINAKMPRQARAKSPGRTQIADTSRAEQVVDTLRVAQHSDTARAEHSAPATPTRSRDSRTAPDVDAVQCSGMTKAGKQCSRKTKEGSAYCWQHAK